MIEFNDYSKITFLEIRLVAHPANPACVIYRVDGKDLGRE